MSSIRGARMSPLYLIVRGLFLLLLALANDAA